MQWVQMKKRGLRCWHFPLANKLELVFKLNWYANDSSWYKRIKLSQTVSNLVNDTSRWSCCCSGHASLPSVISLIRTEGNKMISNSTCSHRCQTSTARTGVLNSLDESFSVKRACLSIIYTKKQTIRFHSLQWISAAGGWVQSEIWHTFKNKCPAYTHMR